MGNDKVKESLKKARDTVNEVRGGDIYRLHDAIHAWFDQYKKWEKSDSCKKALKEGRLTARMVDEWEETKGEIGKPVGWVKVKNREAESWEVTKNYGRHELEIDTSVMGILKSMEPEKYLDGNIGKDRRGKRTKYAEGLYALPASLLNPKYPIEEQLFGLREYMVLMPLPMEQDMQLLYSLGKEKGKDEFYYNLIRHMRNRMTRITLADIRDMHSKTYVLIDEKGYHVRSGYGGESSGIRSKTEIDRMRNNALNYQTRQMQYRKDIGRNNEVLLKYRSHAGDFPLLFVRSSETKYELKRKGDKLLKYRPFLMVDLSKNSISWTSKVPSKK